MHIFNSLRRPAVLCVFALLATIGGEGLLRAQAAENMDSLGDLKKLSLEQLTEVEVTTVSRNPEKLQDTASAIQVITGEEIRRSGATTLAQALRLASNLEVDQKNSHDWGISARGFNTDLSNKLLVMMDGRTLYTPLFSGVRWDVQNYLLADIDRIEVVSGPGATLWGANAVNGVINIISKSARDTQGLYAETNLGTEDRSGYGVRFGGTAGANVAYRFYDTYMDFGPLEYSTSGKSAGDAWSQHQSGFRIDADTSESSHFTFQGDTYNGHEGFVGGGESDVSGGNLLGRWSQTFSERSNYSLQVYYDTAAFRQPTLASAFAPFGYSQDRLDTLDVDFQNQLGLGSDTTLIWGLGYRNLEDDFEPAPGLALNPPKLRQDLVSGFAQLSFQLRPEVEFTIGSKLEYNNYTGVEVQPSARLQWTAAKDQLIWTSVSRAVRTPSRVDRDIAEPSSPPFILVGGENFNAETLIAYEAGYRGRLNSQTLVSAALFYNQYDRIRSVALTPTTILPFFFANDLEGHTYGAELTATYQVNSSWRLIAGYDYLRDDIHVRPGGFDLNNALNETADPQNQFSLRSSTDLPHGLELDGQFRWIDSFTINNNGKPATVPSYADLDLRIGWQATRRFSVALVGQNLLHKSHPEYGAPGPAQVDAVRGVYLKTSFSY